jgi:ketosteroid isomerase-like protein
MRKILIIAALCLCAAPAAAQEPTPTQSPAQPAAQDAKTAERERKEREKEEARAAKEKAAQEAKAAKEAEEREKQEARAAKEKAAQEAKAAKDADAKTAKSQPSGEKVGMSGNAEQEVTQLTDQYIAALKGKDAAALERIWADDLTYINPGGAMLTKAQRLADIQSGANRFDSLEVSDRTVRVYGDTAVMTSLTTMKGQYGGQDASGQYRVTNVFAKRGGGWQIVSLQMTRIAMPPAEKKP